MIDNFDIIKNNLLQFKEPGDFYVIHVIQRAKDLKSIGKYGKGDAPDSQRLIKTWYIDSLDYWNEKIPIIKDVTEANTARAYILPQVRNRLVVNRVLLRKMVDCVDDANLRYDHLIRSAVCGCHTSTCSMWVVDIDFDSLPDNIDRRAYIEEMTDEIRHHVSETKRSPNEVFTVPTRNGVHIITPPFNRTKWKHDPDMLKQDAMTLLYCGF